MILENVQEHVKYSLRSSLIYAGYLFRYISDEIITYPFGTRITALDIGPGYGSGTNLLGELFSGKEYHIDIDTIDITMSYKEILERHPYIHESYWGDVFSTSFEKKYEFIFCSHVIEHMKDPLSFCKKLCKIGKKVFILAPWKEDPKVISDGHYYIFDEKFIDKIKQEFGKWGGVKRFELLDCFNWGQFMNPRYRQFFLLLEGDTAGGYDERR